MMVDLATHGGGLADHRFVQVTGMGGGGVGDDGEGRLQGMGKVAGVTPRFFSLRFAMGQKLVDFADQRVDLAREILADPLLGAGTDGDNFTANATQRPQTVEGL